ncbi:hypothetical protein, partial [Enterococcus casseliflavus]|uniref:hypothetical protein n=1 Tax=Enterococcus casseliflavus TaxID=37734 RepID=UPI003DA1D21B
FLCIYLFCIIVIIFLQNIMASFYTKKGDISDSWIEKDSLKWRRNRRNIGSTFKNNGTRGKEIVLSISK